MWFIYLVLVIVALWYARGLMRKLINSANEFASLAEGASEVYLREEGDKLSQKLMSVKGKKLPSEILSEFRSKN